MLCKCTCLVLLLAHSLYFALKLENAVTAMESQATDEFSRCFRSNEKEMIDVPMFFTHPLPSWLQGTLVRNGLGKFENGVRTFVHVFDAFAKLASWKFIGNGTVLFSTRFIKSGFYRDSMAANTIAPYLLFESVKPAFTYLEKAVCLMRGIDNMNVNVYEFTSPKTKRREYAALNDYWILYKISITKLSTKYRVIPKLKHKQNACSNRLGSLSFISSAHPLPEYGTDNRFNFLSSVAMFPWQSNKMSLVRMKSLKRRKIITQWFVDKIPYMHSFSVTSTKVIFLASPLYVKMWCMTTKVEPFSCLDWYPDKPATLYVVHLRSKKVDAIKIPNVFTMHHVNAYDTPDGNVVMDISSYPNPNFVRHLQLQIMRDPVKRNQFDAHAKLKRITIDMIKKKGDVKDVDPGPPPGIASFLDMPAINEAYRSKHYCYVYGVVVKADNITFSRVAIVKKDLCHAGAGDRVWLAPGHYPQEPWFVAHPRASGEDDGILMVPVFRGAENATFLVMLDAKDLSLINDSKVPTNIPFSLHGRFFPA